VITCPSDDFHDWYSLGWPLYSPPMAAILTTGNVMRPMRENPPGKPMIDSLRNCLGVEVGHDVHPDAQGMVGPIGGMSVIYGPKENLRKLPKPIRPFPYGEGALRVFETEVPSLPADLEVQTTNAHHAVIQPRVLMLFKFFEKLIGSTQPQWKLVQLKESK
jgi:hypothetical protein